MLRNCLMKGACYIFVSCFSVFQNFRSLLMLFSLREHCCCPKKKKNNPIPYQSPVQFLLRSGFITTVYSEKFLHSSHVLFYSAFAFILQQHTDNAHEFVDWWTFKSESTCALSRFLHDKARHEAWGDSCGIFCGKTHAQKQSCELQQTHWKRYQKRTLNESLHPRPSQISACTDLKSTLRTR